MLKNIANKNSGMTSQKYAARDSQIKAPIKDAMPANRKTKLTIFKAFFIINDKEAVGLNFRQLVKLFSNRAKVYFFTNS